MINNSPTFAQPPHDGISLPPIVLHRMSLVSHRLCLLFCAQTGFIRVGDESMFIEPLDENDPLQSFSGLKHRLLRQRRSAKNSSAPENEEPSYCGTIRGKCHGLIHWMTILDFIKRKEKKWLKPERYKWLHSIFVSNIFAKRKRLASRINRTKPQHYFIIMSLIENIK